MHSEKRAESCSSLRGAPKLKRNATGIFISFLTFFMVCNVILRKEGKGEKWLRAEKIHTCIIEPFFKQRLQFAHVFKAQVQGLKARNGGLAEVISIKFSHGKANIPLVHATQQHKIMFKW